MASIEDILAQLGAARTMIADGSMGQETQTAFARNLASQVSMMGEVDLPGASRISNELTSVGFNAADRTLVQNAALQRAMQATTTTRPGSTQTQTLKNPLNYFTGSDYEKLEAKDPAPSQAECVMVVADRCRQLQLFAPSEDTAKSMASLVGAHLWRDRLPTPVESLAIFQATKAQIRAGRPAALSPSTIWVYPATPASLPPAVWHAAYGQVDDPPVAKVNARYHLVRSYMVCRVSHRGLSPVPSVGGAPATRAGSAAPAGVATPTDMISLLYSMITGAAPQDTARSSSQPLINLNLLGGRRPATGQGGQPLALQDGNVDSPPTGVDSPPAAAAEADTAKPTPPPTASGVMPAQPIPNPAAGAAALLRAMETAAAGTGSSKPAGVDGSKPAATPKGKAKATAKAAAIMKRPAAAAKGAPASASMPTPRPAMLGVPLEAQAAYRAAYDAAYKSAESAGLTHQLCLTRAQVAGQKARKRKLQEISG